MKNVKSVILSAVAGIVLALSAASCANDSATTAKASARSAISNRTVSLTITNWSNLEVVYTTETQFAGGLYLYVTEADGYGLVRAHQPMTYSNGAYRYSFNASAGSGSVVHLFLLAIDNGESSILAGNLADPTTWSSFTWTFKPSNGWAVLSVSYDPSEEPEGETELPAVIQPADNAEVKDPTLAASDQPILSGIYTFTAACSGKVLDVSDVSMEDGANVHQWDYVGGANQQWELTYISDNLYLIKSVNSGKYLDLVWNDDTYTNFNVIQNGVSRSDYLKWQIIKLNNGKYRIANYGVYNSRGLSNSGKVQVLDVNGASKENGANIWLYDWNETEAQQWTVTAVL